MGVQGGIEDGDGRGDGKIIHEATIQSQRGLRLVAVELDGRREKECVVPRGLLPELLLARRSRS